MNYLINACEVKCKSFSFYIKPVFPWKVLDFFLSLLFRSSFLEFFIDTSSTFFVVVVCKKRLVNKVFEFLGPTYISMIENWKSLSEVFGRVKLRKNGDLEMYFFYLRKLSRLRGKFCSTALVKDIFYSKYCSVLTQYYKIDLLIFRSFFMQFYATKNFW